VISVLLSVVLICKPPVIEMHTTAPWQKRDQDALVRATKTCRERYVACLKRFVRIQPSQYRAVCMKPAERTEK
jgi:hypothetical protein